MILRNSVSGKPETLSVEPPGEGVLPITGIWCLHVA